MSDQIVGIDEIIRNTENTPDGIPQKNAEWGRSVRSVLSSHAHGMKNVYEHMHGMYPTPVTHRKRFDGFASRH